MRTASVTVAGTDQAGPAIPTVITPDRAWTVGRSTECDIVVVDERVSRRHLVVETSGPYWLIRDVSANGTWAGGVRIGPTGLAIPDSGDMRLRLGDAAGPELVVASRPDPAQFAPPPPPAAPVLAYSPTRAAGGAPIPIEPRRSHRSRALVIALVVLALLLVVADRVAAAAASTAAVREVVQKSQGLNGKPSVSFGGFPFLTQVAFGKYSDIHVGIDNLTLPQGPHIEHVSAHLKGAHIPLSKALHNNVATIPVDHVAATVTLAFADLNSYLKDQPGQLVVSAGSGGTVKVTGSSSNNGDLVNVAGSGELKVEDGQLTVSPDDIKVDGIGGIGDLLGGLGGLSSLFPPIPVPLPNLPFHARITSVRSAGNAVVLSAAADHVVLETGQ